MLSSDLYNITSILFWKNLKVWKGRSATNRKAFFPKNCIAFFIFFDNQHIFYRIALPVIDIREKIENSRSHKIG